MKTLDKDTLTYLKKMDENLRSSFSNIKEEMDEHLTAINENTTEINVNSSQIEQLEMKVEKLNEKIEELQMAISQLTGEKPKQKAFAEISLTSKEQEIFTVIYAKNGDLIEYKQLSRMLGYTELDIEKNINNIIIKGVPIIKQYLGERIYLKLDSDFRNLQAKENLITVKDSITRDLQDRSII